METHVDRTNDDAIYAKSFALYDHLRSDFARTKTAQRRAPSCAFLGLFHGLRTLHIEVSAGSDSTDEITGIDFEKSVVSKANLGVYSPDNWNDFQGNSTPLLTDNEIATWFEFTPGLPPGHLRVSAANRRNISFRQGDLFSSEPALPIESYDLVVCNNLLLHLTKESASQAWDCLARYVSDGGVLVVGGCDPGVRSAAAKRLGFTPVTTNLKEIAKGWRGTSGAWNQNPRPSWAYPEPDEADPDYPFLAGEIFQRNSRQTVKAA